ncbi:MAG: M23 family metallopeptidase [Halobacteriovoraceae bacterium]|nr:M23 family metallopeptidase [Halobacteriovoraceae bacterium]
MEKFSVILVPGNNKKTKTFHIPMSLAKSISVIIALIVTVVGILFFDYFKLVNSVYLSKQLKIENQQLKEQVQIFQMKINSLTDDFERIHTFEKKLRILTGLDKESLTKPYFEEDIKKKEVNEKDLDGETSSYFFENHENMVKNKFLNKLELQNYESNESYVNLKNLYRQKMVSEYGINEQYEDKTFLLPGGSEIQKLSESFAVFDYKYDKLRNFSVDLEKDLNQLDQFLLDRQSLLNSTPILFPASGWITSFYGLRKSPYSGRIKMHEGIDIGAPFGSNIVAPADGIVVFAGIKPGFGKHVQIDHGYGIETVFAHSQKLFVKRGIKIKRGDLIASVGSTGHSTGPHLHYEIRINGVSVDPYYFLLEY